MNAENNSATNSVNPWVIAIAVMFPTALEILDSTVANVALPYISGGLATSVNESTWVLTSYIIANAIMLPITYWFSAKLGRKNFLLASITVFTLSSLMCGFSTSLSELIIFRIIQGFGGGGLTPLSQSILLDVFPQEKHGQAMGFYGFGLLLAPTVGPYIGGWLSDNISWNWIFFINVPLGFIGYFMIKSIIPENFNNNKKEKLRLDLVGLTLLILFIAPFQTILDKGQENDWFSSGLIVELTTIAAISLILLLIWLYKSKNPLINLKIFKDKNYRISVFLIFLRAFSFYGFSIALPLLLENLMGYNATLAGEISIFSGIAVMIAMPIAGNLTSKYNPKYLLLAGVSLCAVALIHMAGFSMNESFMSFALYRAIFGVGSAFIMVPLNTIAFITVPKKMNTQCSGMISLARSLASSIGISTVSTMLARRAQVHQSYLVSNTNTFNHAFNNYVSTIHNKMHVSGKAAYNVVYNAISTQAAYQAYVDIFQTLLIVVILLIPFIFLLKRNNNEAACCG